MMNNQQVCIEEDEIDLRELFATIWKHKVFIAIFVFIVTTLSIIYVLSKPNEYKVYTLLAPQEQSKGMNLGGLGALASMAGVNIGGGSGVTPDQAFQTLLDDYPFMKNFMQKYKITQKLLSGELEKGYIFAMNNDSVYKFFHSKKETTEASQKKEVSFFDFYKSLKGSFSISADKKTGLITISFTGPNRGFDYFVLNKFLEEVSLKEIWNDKEIQTIEEAVTTSMQMRSREAKINAAVAAIAVRIALQKKDPYVLKMLKFRKLWKKYKDEVVKKYGPIAYQNIFKIKQKSKIL